MNRNSSILVNLAALVATVGGGVAISCVIASPLKLWQSWAVCVIATLLFWYGFWVGTNSR